MLTLYIRHQNVVFFPIPLPVSLISSQDMFLFLPLFWHKSPSHQLVAEASAWQHTTLTTDNHDSGGIRTHNLSRWATTDLRLRTCGHWDGPAYINIIQIILHQHTFP